MQWHTHLYTGLNDIITTILRHLLNHNNKWCIICTFWLQCTQMRNNCLYFNEHAIGTAVYCIELYCIVYACWCQCTFINNIDVNYIVTTTMIADSHTALFFNVSCIYNACIWWLAYSNVRLLVTNLVNVFLFLRIMPVANYLFQNRKASSLSSFLWFLQIEQNFTNKAQEGSFG